MARTKKTAAPHVCQTREETMDSIKALVKDHHILYCGHGISKSKAALYLSQLFMETCPHDESSGFELVPVSNLDKLQLIQEHGVKSILLSVGAFDLSLPKEKRDTWIGKVIGKLGDEFSALISNDQSCSRARYLGDIAGQGGMGRALQTDCGGRKTKRADRISRSGL